MDGGPESRCVGCVYSLDGTRHHPNCTNDLRRCRKLYAPTLTSSAPGDGRMRPKHVELRKLQ